MFERLTVTLSIIHYAHVSKLLSDVFHEISKAQAINVKIDKWDCIKLITFCLAKETVNRVKG
jgi:hypothetical protein